jgi:hypothetical protein
LFRFGYLSKVSIVLLFFIDFHVLAPSQVFLWPPRLPPRNISADSPDFEFRYQHLKSYVHKSTQRLFKLKSMFVQLTKSSCGTLFWKTKQNTHSHILVRFEGLLLCRQPLYTNIGAILGCLGVILSCLGAIFKPSWAVLGPCWGHLDAILETCWGYIGPRSAWRVAWAGAKP